VPGLRARKWLKATRARSHSQRHERNHHRGDNNDYTRQEADYDGTYQYLKEMWIEEMKR